MDYQFRSALNGFNRSDVIAYLQNLKESHKAALLDAQAVADHAEEEAARLRDENRMLHKQLAELLGKQDAEPAEPLSEKSSLSLREEELEAYRRAEAMERNATLKAANIEQQAAEILRNAKDKALSTERQAKDRALEIEIEATTKMEHTKKSVNSVLTQLGTMIDLLTETSNHLNSL